ncbi:MAG TPA: SDR family oxidoreductase, partial [Thermoguttaceae bacterium]|nr:SDR family oxidoreductase [Thermoguttaceae bacterium]
ASKGLGKAMALAFAEAGANLILSGRDAADLDQTKAQAEAFGAECLSVVGDVRDQSVFESLVTTARAKQLAVFVNNAGIVTIEPLQQTTLEQIDAMIAVNLTVPIKLTRALLPILEAAESGTIINVNSQGGQKPVLHHTIYCATKYGLNGFAEALRLEVKDRGIRILNVSPGKMATDLFRAAGKDWDTTTFIPPEEVAQATVALVRMSARCCPSEFGIERMP